jgi:hypothetical protein
MRYVYYLIEIGDALALFSVFVLLLRGPFRKFWALVVYVAWELLSNVALESFDVVYNAALTGANASKEALRLYSRLYWTNDVIVDVLRFLLVIWLTYKATSGGPKRASIGRILTGIVVVALALPFLLFPMFPMGPKPWPEASWFNSTSELLNFGAAIMNLVLWGVLLADRKRDPQLAVVSVGLGVVVTGAAISYGFRHLISAEARFIPNMFLMLTRLAGWTIWCRAFWPARNRRAVLDPASGNAMPSA